MYTVYIYIYIYESIPKTPYQKSIWLYQKFRKRAFARGRVRRNRNHCFCTILSEFCVLGAD